MAAAAAATELHHVALTAQLILIFPFSWLPQFTSARPLCALFQHEVARSTLAKINKCIELSYRWAGRFYSRIDELPPDRQI